jgi:hypothetical protein
MEGKGGFKLLSDTTVSILPHVNPPSVHQHRVRLGLKWTLLQENEIFIHLLMHVIPYFHVAIETQLLCTFIWKKEGGGGSADDIVMIFAFQ